MKTLVDGALTQEAAFYFYNAYGRDATVFSLFRRAYPDVEIVTIKLKCQKCGKTWGLSLDDYDEYVDIPDRRFVCSDCAKKEKEMTHDHKEISA